MVSRISAAVSEAVSVAVAATVTDDHQARAFASTSAPTELTARDTKSHTEEAVEVVVVSEVAVNVDEVLVVDAVVLRI